VNCDVAVSPLFIDAMPCLIKLYHVEVVGYCNVVIPTVGVSKKSIARIWLMIVFFVNTCFLSTFKKIINTCFYQDLIFFISVCFFNQYLFFLSMFGH
jgi:hypothetical protein